MPFEVTTTNALEATNISLVVVGPPGIGKTPFALTSPKPFLLNAEAGVQSVAHLEVPMTRIESMAQLLEIRNVLALPAEERNEILGFEVETVIIDTIDEISRIATHERLASQKKAEMQPGDWTWLADEMNALVRGFRGLDMNVILVCHTKDQQSGDTGEVTYKTDISGAFGHQLPAAVDVVGLIERRALINEDGESENRTFLVTDDRRGYGWLKNRGKLPSLFELNFQDDFTRIVEEFFSGVEYSDAEPRTITFQSPEEEAPAAVVDDTPATPANPTVDEVRAKIDAAAAVVEKAEVQTEKPTNKNAAVLTSPHDTSAEDDLDLSGFENGDCVERPDLFKKAGFSLKPDGTLKNAHGCRFVYVLEDGSRILAVNQVEKGVVPIPNPDIGSGIYCQVSGVEVTADQANVSRIKFRKVFSEEVFAAQ